DIGNSDINIPVNEFADTSDSDHVSFQGCNRRDRADPFNGRRVMRSFLKSCTALTMAACFAGQALAQEMKTEVGEGEGALNVVAWAGFLERGETDPKFDWVTKFEESTGCKVSVKTANTSDEMVALMNEGGFDLVTAS